MYQSIGAWRPRLVVLIILAMGLPLLSACTAAPAADTTSQEKGASEGATQRQEGGQVTVAATWNGPGAGPVFTVAMDTHSVDLDSIDLARLTVLRTPAGEVAATEWSAPKGGHHRSGELRFPSATPDGRPTLATGPVELVVRDVAGVPERSFRWQS
ncbi:MAG: hypothetical protein IT305_01010 [Chloroflexi bacterium]|nr:hypothetical protein [Chloroflexota bacterium]